MKSSEAIIGEYYHVFDPDSKTFLIVKMEKCGEMMGSRKIDEDRIIGDYIANMNNPEFEFIKSSTIYFGDDRKTRIATWEERVWLDQCVEEGEFIPFKNIKIESNYEIY